ncbi:MAG: hypothetical protein WC729_17320 [Sphingomonas sp.]|jgi:hypothetical protein|uniref:hypothetical protein n=1 Tax=Sphingomonas sp. TaxID=28214 RepID=UPI003565455B
MRIAAGLCIALLLAPAAVAAKDVPGVIASGDRAVARSLQLALPQDAIETNIEVGRVASDSYGGGLLGALIIESMDDKKETMSQSLHERAEATVKPLREALKTFDVAGLALATTRGAVAKTDWFQAQDIIVTDDPSPRSRAAFLNASATPQVAFVTYRYDLAPDFTYLRVIADIALVRKPAAGARSTSLPEPFYGQSISSIVQLRTRSYEHGENVASWAASDGKLARASLTAAFGQIERLIPFALGLGPADIKLYTAKNRPKAFAAGFYGPRIDIGEGAQAGTLLWSNGLIYVQPAPAT